MTDETVAGTTAATDTTTAETATHMPHRDDAQDHLPAALTETGVIAIDMMIVPVATLTGSEVMMTEIEKIEDAMTGMEIVTVVDALLLQHQLRT